MLPRVPRAGWAGGQTISTQSTSLSSSSAARIATCVQFVNQHTIKAADFKFIFTNKNIIKFNSAKSTSFGCFENLLQWNYFNAIICLIYHFCLFFHLFVTICNCTRSVDIITHIFSIRCLWTVCCLLGVERGVGVVLDTDWPTKGTNYQSGSSWRGIEVITAAHKVAHRADAQIRFQIWTNIFCNFDKYIVQFVHRNIFESFWWGWGEKAGDSV